MFSFGGLGVFGILELNNLVRNFVLGGLGVGGGGGGLDLFGVGGGGGIVFDLEGLFDVYIYIYIIIICICII